jgi:hypothetical protein
MVLFWVVIVLYIATLAGLSFLKKPIYAGLASVVIAILPIPAGRWLYPDSDAPGLAFLSYGLLQTSTIFIIGSLIWVGIKKLRKDKGLDTKSENK